MIWKRLISSIAIGILLLGIAPYPVAAVNSDTAACVQNDACFYSDIDTATVCDPTLGGAAGSGPLYGPLFPKVADTKKLADSIKAYIENSKPDSPFNTAHFAAQFVSGGIKYDVNPALAIAQLQMETGLGTVGHARPPKYNAFNIRNGPGGSFGSYANYDVAIEEYYSLIKRVYTGPPSNITSVQALINKYAPPSDGNDVSLYLKTVNEIMLKILGGLEAEADPTTPESETPAEPAETPATEVPETATDNCSPSNAGELGWELSGEHAMVSYDQTDAKYADHPYGAGKSPIGESGCGPTSVAMVVATLGGNKSINPITIADKYGARFHVESGSSHALFPEAAKDYNLNIETLGTNLNRAAEILKDGGLVIISVDAGHFTGGGHIMVLRAVTTDGTGFFINDPNGKGRNGDSETRSFDAAFLNGEGGLKAMWGYTKK